MTKGKVIMPTMKWLATLGLALLLPAAHATTAVVFSESTGRYGVAWNEPGKEEAIKKATEDCRYRGGGKDCKPVKISDTPGFGTVAQTCAGGFCGISIITGRRSEAEAEREAVKDCNSQYGTNSCRAYDRWRENGVKSESPVLAKESVPQSTSSPNSTITNTDKKAKSDGYRLNEQAKPTVGDKNQVTLSGGQYSLAINKPPFTKGPLGALNQTGAPVASNGAIMEGSAKFNARFPLAGAGVSYVAHFWEATNKGARVFASVDDVVVKALERIGLKREDATPAKVPDSGIPGAVTVGYFAYGLPFNNVFHGERTAYIYAVLLPDKSAGYALISSVVTPVDKSKLVDAGIKVKADASDVSKSYAIKFWDMYNDLSSSVLDERIRRGGNDGIIAAASDNGKGKSYWRAKFERDQLMKKAAAVACVRDSFPGIRKKYGDGSVSLICKLFVLYGLDPRDLMPLSEAEDYVQLIDPEQADMPSKEAMAFIEADATDTDKNSSARSVKQAASAMNWLIKNYQFSRRVN